MPSAYDIENAIYDGIFLSAQEQASDTHGFVLSFDESRIYISNFVNDTIYEYLNSGTIETSDGLIEVRVDGVTVLSVSDAKTIYSDDRFYSFVALHCGSGIAHGVTTDIDDWYIWDDSGAWNNSFLGDKRAVLKAPDADTNVSDFQPISGDLGYLMVDEDSPDDDTTYIFVDSALLPESPPLGSSEFEVQNLQNGVSHIAGVSIFTRAKKTDSSDVEIFTSIISDVNAVSGSPHDLAETYGYHVDLYEYDPFTIANFTRNGFNLALFSINAEFAVGLGSPAESPAPGFSPDDIASLFRWYDASQLALSDNDPVSSWTDLSANADHAVQATGTNQPTFKTGTPMSRWTTRRGSTASRSTQRTLTDRSSSAPARNAGRRSWWTTRCTASG
jgi:hypothetical protein